MLKWSTTWWRGARFYHCRSVDRWILTGGIDRFSIAYSSGFTIRISVKANLDDRVVIDEVPIGDRVGPSTRFFVTSFSYGRLKRGRRVLESDAQDRRRTPFFLLLSWVLKIVVVRRSSYSDRRRVPLWIMTFWTGTACPSRTSRRRSTMPCGHKDESQRFLPTWRASVDVWSSDIWSRIRENISQRHQSHVNTKYEVLDWFGPSRRVIAICPVLMYYAIEISSSLFLLRTFGVFRGFSGLSSIWIYPLYL
jgi:hypothetical protein